MERGISYMDAETPKLTKLALMFHKEINIIIYVFHVIAMTLNVYINFIGNLLIKRL